MILNNEGCRWDGGDCCEDTCVDGSAFDCGFVGAWHGAGAYFLGVVDILQEWTWWKQLEWFWKIWVCRYNSEGVSAIPPAPYAKRFQEHVCAIVSSMPPPPPPSLMSVQCPGERSLLDGLSPCDGEGLNEAYSSDLIGEAEHIMPLHASQTDIGV